MTNRLGLSLAAFACWLAITILVGNFTTGGDTSLLDGVQSHFGWTWLSAGGFILAVVLWQGWRDVGLDRWPDWQGWRLTWFPLLYIGAGLIAAILFGLPPASVLLIILVNTLMVGFSEELMLRGVMLQAFRHVTTIWPAVLLTSLLFGAMHSLNVFVTGDLGAALVQSCAAFLSGLLFIALRLRTGSLWPPILLHALWDFTVFVLGSAVGRAIAPTSLPGDAATQANGSHLTALTPVLLVLPTAIYGLWLMRNIALTHTDPDV